MIIIRENLVSFDFPYHFAIVNPRETLQFVINLKVFVKFHLASHFGLSFKKELKFKKEIHIFYYLGLHLYLCENEGYSTPVAKTGFFMRKNLSKKLQFFLQVENV